jgi:hypothetical protein
MVFEIRYADGYVQDARERGELSCAIRASAVQVNNRYRRNDVLR